MSSGSRPLLASQTPRKLTQHENGQPLHGHRWLGLGPQAGAANPAKPSQENPADALNGASGCTVHEQPQLPPILIEETFSVLYLDGWGCNPSEAAALWSTLGDKRSWILLTVFQHHDVPGYAMLTHRALSQLELCWICQQQSSCQLQASSCCQQGSTEVAADTM